MIRKIAVIVFSLVALSSLRAQDPSPASVLEAMQRVADWQLAHQSDPSPNSRFSKLYVPGSWVLGAFWTGVAALDDVASDRKYLAAIEANGAALHWECLPNIDHADDSAVLFSFLKAYQANPRPEILDPALKRVNAMMADVAQGKMGGNFPKENYHWNWCDALFMEPPALARLSAITGNSKYLQFVNAEWAKTRAALFDPEEGLYFRDGSYLTKKEANGRKVFWARGNGWVFAGYTMLLEYVPKNDPARAGYETEFRAMAKALLAAQQSDGFWRASLLDPASYPVQETSGTGFIATGLAYGVNAGLLDGATYRPAALKAWQGLNTCVEPDGKVTHAQPVGSDPKKFDPSNHEPYGAGAFLLCGAQIYRMVGGKPAITTAAKDKP